MFNKILATVIIIIALIVAVIASIWPHEGVSFIIMVSRFFDVMLPVLAVGALLKYILCCCPHKHHE